MLNCYYDHHIIYNIIRDFNIIGNNIDFDYYLINNNSNIDISNYKNICNVIDGDNSSYEFSGIQKCINILIDNKKINNYDAFIMMTDKLLNHPISYTMKFNIDIIENALNNEIAIGLIDSWEQKYTLDDFFVEKWIRTNFIIINKHLFEKINYSILSYNVNDIFEDGEDFYYEYDITSRSSIESASTAADAPRIAAFLSLVSRAFATASGRAGTSSKLDNDQLAGLSTITGSAPAPVALVVGFLAVGPLKFSSMAFVDFRVLPERHFTTPFPKSTKA
jgi:hypothetical protein